MKTKQWLIAILIATLFTNGVLGFLHAQKILTEGGPWLLHMVTHWIIIIPLVVVLSYAVARLLGPTENTKAWLLSIGTATFLTVIAMDLLYGPVLTPLQNIPLLLVRDTLVVNIFIMPLSYWGAHGLASGPSA